MKTRPTVCLAVVCSICVTGCMTVPDPPDGDNGITCDPPAEGEAVICLGTHGVLRIENSMVASTQVTQDLREQFPAEPPTAIRVTIDADDVSLADTNGEALTVDGTATVLIFWSAEDAPDSCAALGRFNQFIITVVAGEVVSVAPAQSALDGQVVAVVADGTFGVCVTLTSSIEGDFTIASMNLQFAG